jgi:hypothetical protein
MAWPGMVEYSAAVQSQRASFLAPELQSAKVVTNKLGLPKVAAGAFAIVYQLEAGRDTWAIRCFTRDVGDLQERYAAIAEHLRKAKLSRFVPFDYLSDGIRVGGKTYPIMKMQWVEGVPLNRYVEQHLGDSKRLLALAGQFGDLAADLEKAKVGHGDLSADNVLMVGDEARLIDYDGMYVPKLAGRKARELGNAAFQHPRRDANLFGPDLDRFSVLLIATALAALAADPGLWKRHAGGNGLLFSPADLRQPKGSPLFRALLGGDPMVAGLAGELAAWCEADPAKLGKLPSLKKLKLGAAPVAPAPARGAAAPAAVATVVASPAAAVPAGGLTVAVTVPPPNGAAAQAAAPAPHAAPARARPAGPSTVARLSGLWRRLRRPGPAASPAPKPPAPRPRPPAAQAGAPAAARNATVRVAAARVAAALRFDWNGVVAAGLALGFFGVLFAPETGSLSVVALPGIVALAAFSEAAAQRAAAAAPPGDPAHWGGVVVTGAGVAFFSIVFAPETGSASLIAAPTVIGLMVGAKRAAARAHAPSRVP